MRSPILERSAAIPSGYEVFIDGARVATGLDAIEWVKRGEDLGAGEIVVNSIDNDGTAAGYELDITRAVADAVNVKMISLDQAPSGYTDFDKGAATKFVIDPHKSVA